MTREEAIIKSTEYFNGDELAASVFVDKYALKDDDGNYLEMTPDDLHKRLAKELARIENKYPNPMSEEEIYESLKNFKKIVPQGSPMAGIGNDSQIMSVSNCFVIGSPEDSYGGIMKADEEIAQLSKRRAGIGLDITNIRPKGLVTKNAARTTDGIGVFMDRFSNTCREVAQGGRRGAELQSISIHHPEVETFITIKNNKTRVTGANISIKLTEEFMTAVKNNREYEQRWPVNSPNPQIRKTENAKRIWNLIIENAWSAAEPGLLFWDNVEKNTPSEAYEEYKAVSTNPCLVGDTKVYVADGRGVVTIKELADAGEDVDVFCYDNENNVVIRKMRNPRVTGYDEKIYTVTFDDGNTIRTTGNHKFLLKTGEYKEVKDLQFNDQLSTIVRFEDSIAYKFDSKPSQNKNHYVWIKSDNSEITEHRTIAKHNCGNIDGLVVHHIDFNSKNNAPENLKPMTRDEHVSYHKDKMCGDNNPMRRAATEWSAEKIQQYSDNMSKIKSGFGNGHVFEISNDDIKQHAISFTKSLGRRFSSKEWQVYAEENSLPKAFTKFRQTPEYKNPVELSFVAANECGLVDQNHDPRLLNTRINAESQGYETKIIESELYVKKVCERCGTEFWTSYFHREQGLCSVKCVTDYLNSNSQRTEQRVNATKKAYSEKQNVTKNKILDEYTKLKTTLGREPMFKELENQCKSNSVPIRLYTKYGFKSYEEIKEAAKYHNHRVVSVIESGNENVYNGTVDEFHNFFVGGFDVNDVKNSLIFLNNKNCGEIVLSPYDSCRLVSMNTLGFVKNKYTADAYFDYDEFSKYVNQAQRYMDDIVDIELVQIEKILSKIDSDPEDDETKRTEKNLWEKIKSACFRGRRTGLGITALGDTLAAIGIKYGSLESIDVVEKIYKTLEIAAYEASIEMAKERGSFPAFDYNKEINNSFISKIIDNVSDEHKSLYKQYGRRNIALTTTAPAGSVSIMTQTSSGIEPVFMLSYNRRKKINPSENVEPDFIDSVGDKWKTFTVYHHELKNWMEVTGETDETKSPWYGATAQDIDWVASVDLQATAQRWVCHSISKTCNLPNSATKELVADVYMRAWESGCKGFTVYRDGCRDGVLVSNTKKEEKEVFQEHNAPKRPESLECDIHQVKIKGEAWTIFVGLMDGKPYEIMGGKSSFVNISKKIVKGMLVKNSKKAGANKSIYDLHYGDDDAPTIIKDVVRTFENPTEGEFSRMVSLALRHGSPVQYIVEQLQKDEEGDLYSFSKVLSRVLKTYIKDGIKVKAVCKNCGSDKLIYQEGCLSCSDCGFSKC